MHWKHLSHSKVDASALVAGSTSEANLQKIFVCIDLQGPKEVFSLKLCIVAWKLSILHVSYHSPTVNLRFFDALSWVSCATLRLSHGKTREVSAPSFPSAKHHDASTVRITPVKVWVFFSGRNRSGNRFGWLSAVNQHLLLSSFKRFQMYRFVDVYVCVCSASKTCSRSSYFGFIAITRYQFSTFV